MQVNIGFDPTFAEWNQNRPDISGDEHYALVDTGASISGVDTQLAIALQLPTIGQTQLSGAVGGVQLTNVYLAQIHVPETGWNFIGRFAGVSFTEGRAPHRAIIGRDFLQYFNLNYEGRLGQVVLSDDPLVPVDQMARSPSWFARIAAKVRRS